MIDTEKTVSIMTDVFVLFPLLREKLTLAMVPGDIVLNRRLQFVALNYIAANEGLSLGDLSDKLHITKQHMLTVINVLDKKGLIVRSVLESDRRYVSIRISEKGSEYLERTKQYTARQMAGLCLKLGDDYQDKVQQTLRELITLLEKLPNKIEL
nr:MarR family transcriptional regulator [bacterium]